jgi:hypothetical protein
LDGGNWENEKTMRKDRQQILSENLKEDLGTDGRIILK